MTVVPSFLVTGVLAIVLSLAALVWAAAFVQRKNGGPILILLSILMLLVGAGFVPTFMGIVAGIAGTRIHAPLTLWRRLPGWGQRLLARAWPWTLITFVGWSFGGWILGHFFNQAMMSLSFALFVLFDVGLPLLTALAGFARDIRDW